MPPLSDTLQITTSISNSLFPTKPTHPSLSPPKPPLLLHFPPSLSSPTPSLSLSKPPLPSPPPLSSLHDTILFLDSLGIDFLSLKPPSSLSLSSLKPLFSLLRSPPASLSPSDLRRVSSMCPDLLSLSPSSVLPVLTFLLREASVPPSSLRHVIHRRPRLLLSSVPSRLRPTLYFLQSTLNLSDIPKHTYLLSCSVENKLIPRIHYFRHKGLSETDTNTIFRRFPPLFNYSIEKNFDPKFDYFTKQMGRGLKEIVEFPQYFSFSLENRIKPRHRKCVEKGVSLSLPMMLKSSEQRFLERLEVCCDSSMPILGRVHLAQGVWRHLGDSLELLGDLCSLKKLRRHQCNF